MSAGGFFVDEDFEPAVPLTATSSTSRVRGPPQQRRTSQQQQHDDDFDFDEEGAAELDALEREERGRSSGVGAPSSASAAAGVSKCMDCKETEGQQQFFDAFGLSVCYDCQRVAKGPGGKYQVITKSKAKDEFLLSDRQLDKAHGGLGCLTVKNPHDSRYGDMRLYLRAQVEEVALLTWGTDEALFNEKERRATERVQKAEARKRKAADKLSHGMAAGGNRKAPAARRVAAVAAATAASHTHTYPPEEEHEYDAATDMWTKRCACGFALEYERM